MKYHRRSASFPVVIKARNEYYEKNPNKSIGYFSTPVYKRSFKYNTILLVRSKVLWAVAILGDLSEFFNRVFWKLKDGNLLKKIDLELEKEKVKSFYETFGKD